MEFWEFLLQKEGDRTWLPLEAAKVEILEGRYRVMAHSSHTDTSVEIRVSQMLLEDTPPKRRILKRTSHTNQDGLMVVMPFTRLQPGAWELQCIYQDSSKNDWRHSVQLQVLSQEDETSGEWNPSWEEAGDDVTATSAGLKTAAETSEQEPGQRSQPHPPVSRLGDLPQKLPQMATVGSTATSETANIAQMQNAEADLEKTQSPEGAAAALKLADQLSRQIVDSVFKEIEQALVDSGSTITPESPSTPPADGLTSTTIPACAINLSQSAFMAQQGLPLAIGGQIVLDPTATTSEISDARLPASELQIHLRDPNNAEVLLEQTYPLENTVLPADFTLDLALPSPLPTRLMLGEVTLHLFQPNVPAAAWASQTFTITAPINELLEAIANEAEGRRAVGDVDFSLESEQSPEEEGSQPDEAILSIPNDCPLPSPKRSKSVFQPLSKQPLPPRLSPPAPDPAADRPLILPNFPTASLPLATRSPQSIEQPPAEESFNQAVGEPLLDLPEMTKTEEVALGKDDLQPDPDELSASQPERAHFDQVDTELAAATIQSMGEEAVNPVARATPPAVDNAFKALNLQKRFWSRLSALTTEGYQEAAEFRSAVKAAGVRMSATEAATEVAADDAWLNQTLLIGEDNSVRQLAEEIVVYEEMVEAAPIESLADPTVSESVESGAASRGDDAEVITPTPILTIPAAELTAGEVIFIDVSLPPLEVRTYVKLWISDRQTRALLDKPLWLMDFQSLDKGELSTRLRLTIPLGCSEIRFTAIAVNMITQQESYKAVVDRRVFPPDLPPLILDEFEV